MAAGDFTITATSLQIMGQLWQISGTAEVDGTKRAFDILPSKHIVDFTISGKDDAGAVEVDMNENASGTADEGNVALQSQIEPVNTYNWTAQFV